MTGRPAFSGWFGLIGATLALVLLAAGLVQTRQLALLSQTLRAQSDYVVLSLYEAEIEYLRLREQWQRALDDGPGMDRAALQLRYEIWVSRIDLLETTAARRLVTGSDPSRDAMGRIRAFIAQADRHLSGPVEAGGERATAAALKSMFPALLALNDPIHGLSLGAAHQVAEQLAQRNQTVHVHNQVGIALTVFLCLLTVAFAYVALRQMRKLEQRRDEMEQLMLRLRDARAEAESASEAKSVFLANMSHEIRTPFHGLLGMLWLLRQTGLNPRQLEYLRTATESADHLLAILNDILDMSQLESGRLLLKPGPVTLRTMVGDVEALMRPQAAARSLALHVAADAALPERLIADATRVKQVLFNLLSNAIRFCDHGSVSLDVRSGAPVDGVPQIEFVVADTGIGMDDATMKRLFKRFSQGDASTQRRHGGTGLGLEISRNLARLMGGDIGVESRPGHGSCFTFRLPAIEAPAEEQAATGPAATPEPPQRALRVLVAEDHPVNRRYMEALLQGLGHEAEFAGNGLEAVDAARTRPFDVILMDLHMPELDGIEATQAIRALPDSAAATVPIVALTADAFPQTRERCLVAGMNDFLTKPVGPQHLAATLRRFFGPMPQAAVPADAVPTGAPPPQQPAGWASLLDRALIDDILKALPRERVAALLGDFLDRAPATLGRLRKALRDGQVIELGAQAHALRGTALNLGLSGLAVTARALQDGATNLPAHEIARLVQTIEDLLPATRDACREAGLLDGDPAQPATAGQPVQD